MLWADDSGVAGCELCGDDECDGGDEPALDGV